MASRLQLPSAVRDQPPSARLVYLALVEGETPMTVDTITAETGVSADRVRRLLGYLLEEDLVTADEHPSDGRRKVWTVARDQPVVTPGATATADAANTAMDAMKRRNRATNPRGDAL